MILNAKGEQHKMWRRVCVQCSDAQIANEPEMPLFSEQSSRTRLVAELGKYEKDKDMEEKEKVKERVQGWTREMCVWADNGAVCDTDLASRPMITHWIEEYVRDRQRSSGRANHIS